MQQHQAYLAVFYEEVGSDYKVLLLHTRVISFQKWIPSIELCKEVVNGCI